MKNIKQESQSLNQRYHPSKLRYARLLLQLYHNQEASKHCTIDQFINQYALNLTPPQNYRSKLEQQLQIGQYKHLSNTLQVLTQQASQNVQRLQQLNHNKYSQIKKIMAQKQEISLDNIEARLSSFAVANEGDEQLIRVKKIMQNGVWGCLNRLNQRLCKLRQLQSDN